MVEKVLRIKIKTTEKPIVCKTKPLIIKKREAILDRVSINVRH